MRTAVLVASGDVAERGQVALVLGDERYTVLEASDTTEAIRLIAEQLPPLLVLDRDLDGPGALAIARTVAAQPETADLRVLVLTDRPVGDLAEQPGVDATLARPFTAWSLLRKVEALLDD